MISFLSTNSTIENKNFIIKNDLIVLLRKLDRDTFLHGMRVGEMLYQFGQFLNLSQQHTNQLQLIGYIHDIGKIMIPLNILTKCAPLTDSEWDIMKNHGIYGYHLLNEIISNKDILNPVRYHHENLDGTGYEGLVGNQIDFNSRLVRIVDSFDVLTNDRCYKHKSSVEFSLNELQELSGSIYDKELVDQFIKFII